MATQSGLQAEIAEHQRAIGRLSEEIRTIQNFIVADERNSQHPVETVRVNAQLSLNNYRMSLAEKQNELQAVQQLLLGKQRVLAKMVELTRKEQEVQRLEDERNRIISLYEKARSELTQLELELDGLVNQAPPQPAALVMADGQRIPLPVHDAELLIGCKDIADGIYPSIDLTPFGGTASGVSRRHATLSHRHGQWTVRDENSTNGTFVDGYRIASQTPTAVKNGTRLRFGSVESTFSLVSAPSAGKTTRLS